NLIVFHDYTFFFFFFQAEDGIRDRTVTGVQTCALPIFTPYGKRGPNRTGLIVTIALHLLLIAVYLLQPKVEKHAPPKSGEAIVRSEERRVGKESSTRRRPSHEKEK